MSREQHALAAANGRWLYHSFWLVMWWPHCFVLCYILTTVIVYARYLFHGFSFAVFGMLLHMVECWQSSSDHSCWLPLSASLNLFYLLMTLFHNIELKNQRSLYTCFWWCLVQVLFSSFDSGGNFLLGYSVLWFVVFFWARQHLFNTRLVVYLCYCPFVRLLPLFFLWHFRWSEIVVVQLCQ